MNYNNGTTMTYRPGDELTRTHKSATSIREDRFIVSHVGNYHGHPAVFGRKWMKKREAWSKGTVFIEYFHEDRGDRFEQ